jgi:hypothetical protein
MTTQAYVFDTMGTTVPIRQLKGLNTAFFEHAESELGYSAEELQTLRAQFDTNKKDPRFLRGSSRGKAQLLGSGLYEMTLYKGSNNGSVCFR